MDALLSPPASLSASWRARCQFLREAFRHCTRALLVVVLLLGLTRSVVLFCSAWINTGEPPLDMLVLRPLLGEVLALGMLAAVLIAEHCVRNRARRPVAYVTAVVVGAAAVGLLCGGLGTMICPIIEACRVPGPPRGVDMWSGLTLYYMGDALGRGGLAACVYSYREQMLGSIRALRAAEVERADTERRVNAARLLALQEQVDPRQLLDKLAHVEALYASAPGEADRLLAQLIEELRSVSNTVSQAAHAP